MKRTGNAHPNPNGSRLALCRLAAQLARKMHNPTTDRLPVTIKRFDEDEEF